MAYDRRKAHQSPSPRRRGGGRQSAGRAHKRGLNTKLHLAVDAHGMPLRVLVTAGPVADCTQAGKLIEGLPAEHLIADKGYDSDEIVAQAARQNMQAQIPPRKHRKQQRVYDKSLYKLRHLVENAFRDLKEWRGIATRYAKRTDSFLAMRTSLSPTELSSTSPASGSPCENVYETRSRMFTINSMTDGAVSNATSSDIGDMADADLPVAVQSSVAENRILTRHRAPLYAITGLRFFAACYVIVFHTHLSASLLQKGYYLASNFVSDGYLAVPLFFILSGYILAYNYCGQVETLSHSIRFWEARFARIWPAYIFSLLCSSLPLSHIPSLPMAVSTICMVQSWNPFHPEYANAWNAVCWTLSVEAFFYLIFPLLQICIEKIRLQYLVIFGLCMILIAIVFNTPYRIADGRYPGPWFYIPAPIIHLPEFVVGVILGDLFLQSHDLSNWFKSLHWRGDIRLNASANTQVGLSTKFPIITLVGFICPILVFFTPHGHWEGLVIPTFGALLYGLSTEQSLLSRLLSTRVLVLGGEISYAMYLLRTPLHTWVFSIFSPQVSNLVQFLYLPFGLIPLSLASFYLIEGPSRRALRRFFAMLQSSQS